MQVLTVIKQNEERNGKSELNVIKYDTNIFLVMLPCGIRCSLMYFNYFKMTPQNKNTYFYTSHPGNRSSVHVYRSLTLKREYV